MRAYHLNTPRSVTPKNEMLLNISSRMNLFRSYLCRKVSTSGQGICWKVPKSRVFCPRSHDSTLVCYLAVASCMASIPSRCSASFPCCHMLVSGHVRKGSLSCIGPLPISYCLFPEANLMISGASKMLDKLIAQHLPRDAVFPGEAVDSFSQALGQARSLI